MKGLDPDLRALQEMRDQVAHAKAAVLEVADYTQEDVDRLCQAMCDAGAAAAFDLARLAVEETAMGRVHDKVLKNLLGSEGVWDSIRDERTVGIISRDEARGLLDVATPVGVIAGVIPTTNPTSTALFKSLISVKGRNAIVISPHPRAKRCIGETVEVLRRAIERAGGPPDLVCCLSDPTIESTGALMRHRDVAIILSTGGTGLVKAAYSSGKPAYGVGPGNVPAYVDRSADLVGAAEALISSQSFDNATLCCSEQALVLDRPIAERMLSELAARGAHLCSPDETRMLEDHCVREGHMNPDVVGQDPERIAALAGFHVPSSTALLLAHQAGVGPEHPLSIEILCPLLSVHVVDGWQEGCATCKATLHFGGLGHTLVIHAEDEQVLDAFFLQKPASRIVVNGPSSMGAVGFSTHLMPSMSLGCGPQAGNITSDNITARHLINLKRVAFPRRDWKEIERRAHERASQLTGESAPRGGQLTGESAPRGRGLAGDSALSRPVPTQSNWRGNSAVVLTATKGARATRRAPTFTGSPVRTSGSAPVSFGPQRARTRSAPAVAVSATDAVSATEVGGGLTVTEIQSILEHAGSGCPLGPCKGCPHNEVTTGACTA